LSSTVPQGTLTRLGCGSLGQFSPLRICSGLAHVMQAFELGSILACAEWAVNYREPDYHFAVFPNLLSNLTFWDGVQPPVAASEYASALQHIPQFAKLGPVFKSAEPLLLTEEETEYNIALVVHVMETHVLLQFNCTNTVAEQVLENVNVVVDLAEAVSAASLLHPVPPLCRTCSCCCCWPDPDSRPALTGLRRTYHVEVLKEIEE
jgi:hypothetical protein